MRKTIFWLIALLFIVVSCGSKPARKDTEQVKDNNNNTTMTTGKRTLVEIQTTLGNITIALYDETPKHRDNFIKLVNEGYYNGTLFHRVINEFMIQAGDGNSRNARPGQMLGSGGPGYNVDAEIVYPRYFHKKGALAAARQADQINPEKKSSGSQFYIVTGKAYSSDQLAQMDRQVDMMRKQNIFQSYVNERREEIMALQAKSDTAALNALQKELIAKTESETAKNPGGMTEEQKQAYSTVGGTPHLDGQYTVFGEVVSGMDVVEKIEKAETGPGDRPKTDIKIIDMKILK